MNQIDFLKKNIVAELAKQGASIIVAQDAAEYAAWQYRTITDVGKDPFGELVRVAGNMAMKNQPGFRYVQPKPKVTRRFKA